MTKIFCSKKVPVEAEDALTWASRSLSAAATAAARDMLSSEVFPSVEVGEGFVNPARVTSCKSPLDKSLAIGPIVFAGRISNINQFNRTK